MLSWSSSHAAGFLLTTGRGAVERRDISRIPSVRAGGEFVPGWHLYQYVTQHPIPEVDNLGDPPFAHTMLLRWGRSSLLALAHSYRVVQDLLKTELRPLLSGGVRLNEIRVHELIVHMMGEANSPPHDVSRDSAQPAESDEDLFRTYYTLSFAAGRTDAFGEDLRKMQFYGDRVSKATLFEDCLPLMRFYSCTLRHSGTDVVKLGRDGFVSFDVPQTSLQFKGRLAEVNRVLRLLTDRGYIL